MTPCKLGYNQFLAGKTCWYLKGIFGYFWRDHKKVVLLTVAGVILFKIHKSRQEAQRR